MTASEFAFLALGLVLGVASGAALSIVIRARPPAPREVRVTVAHDLIPRRSSATLSAMVSEASTGGPARGGPADPAELVATNRLGSARSAATTREADARAAEPIEPRTPVPISTAPRPPIAIPIQPRPDPFFGSLALAAMAPASRAMPAELVALPSTRSAPLPGVSTIALASDDVPPETRLDGPSEPGDVEADAPAGEAQALCAEERRLAEERCALAERLHEEGSAAADRLREARREYDEHELRARAAAETADPRAVRAAKESAWSTFRQANARAASPEAVEGAAREWLLDIDRINKSARDAAADSAREQAGANGLVTVIERLELEANAARINAESADEACMAAREALASCEEAAATPLAEVGSAAGSASIGAEAADAVEEAGRPRLVGGPELEPGELALDEEATERVFGDREPVIVQLLRGDREAMGRVVVALAGDHPGEQRSWQLQLGLLVEAIVARAIEASALHFPQDDAFWARFSQAQCRDISTALASLGYRFDGLGSFADGRVPSQRDLSLAVGYAGLDPMRIRQWPTEREMPDLYRDVAVAADEFLAGAAGALTLGEMVALLRGRAEDLTDLWNAWGRIRPLLLQS